jgi:hypothetical protein
MNPSPINMEFPNSALADFPREVDIPTDKLNGSKIYLYDDTISSANSNAINYIALSTNPTAKTGEIHKWFTVPPKPQLNASSTPSKKPNETVKIVNDELTTQFFMGSMTVVGLYIFYRMLLKSY